MTFLSYSIFHLIFDMGIVVGNVVGEWGGFKKREGSGRKCFVKEEGLCKSAIVYSIFFQV